MTEIHVNKAYVADRVYYGTTSDGRKYEIIVVRGKGKNQAKIGISVNNPPSNVGANGAFKITKICSVQNRNWYDKKNHRWSNGGDVTVRCNVKSLAQLTDQELQETENLDTDYKPQYPTFEEIFR